MIAAIVLAAGKSRRMGTQKLLLPIKGRPLIVHVVNEVLHSAVERVLVVVGPESGAVCEALTGLNLTLITNPAEDGDMLSSIRCGLNALPPECSGLLIAPADQPGISAELINRLITAQQQSGKPLVVPVCQGRRGHPVLVDMRFRDRLLIHYDGTGLRGLLQDHADGIAEVEVDDPRMLEDMDLPADYDRLMRTLRGVTVFRPS